MNLIELEEKVDYVLSEIAQISILIKDFEKEFISEDQYFKQVKEIESTILNFQKLSIPIPEDLRKFKLSLIDKVNSYDTLVRIRNKYYQGIKVFDYVKENKAEIKNIDIDTVDYTYTKPKCILLFGQQYDVSYWKDIVLETAAVIYELHKNDFDKILNIKGKKRPYFSMDSSLLRDPRIIKSTKIYAEINMGSALCMKVSRRILIEFGYKSEDLEVVYEN